MSFLHCQQCDQCSFPKVSECNTGTDYCRNLCQNCAMRCSSQTRTPSLHSDVVLLHVWPGNAEPHKH